jgi:hypothetical protein
MEAKDGFCQKTDKALAKHKSSTQPDQTVFITDGAQWIRDYCDNYPDAYQILDAYHVLEKVASFAKEVIAPIGRNSTLWCQRQCDDLLAGKASQVTDRLNRLSLLKAAHMEARSKLVTYLQNNIDRMDYASYRKKGYRIGSAPVESAHKTIVQSRMKLLGQRWKVPGAENMLKLKTHIENHGLYSSNYYKPALE